MSPTHRHHGSSRAAPARGFRCVPVCPEDRAAPGVSRCVPVCPGVSRCVPRRERLPVCPGVSRGESGSRLVPVCPGVSWGESRSPRLQRFSPTVCGTKLHRGLRSTLEKDED
uniref:Uncharacterized protein n=1 Tax=Knipowitschia caucasica TaxID=637954 RepID=A0AAV2LA91_KNICA